MNIWIGSSRYVAVRSWRAWCMVIIYARSMLCTHGSLVAIFRPFEGLHISYFVSPSLQCPLVVFFGGLNDPFVYVVAMLRWISKE